MSYLWKEKFPAVVDNSFLKQSHAVHEEREGGINDRFFMVSFVAALRMMDFRGLYDN